jgi:hypothetical protein
MSAAAAAITVTMADCNVNEPEESYNVKEYYEKQLEQKEKEIIHLKKQLENLKKLINFYKTKATNSGYTSDAPVNNQSLKLDQAVQAVITDTIKLD